MTEIPPQHELAKIPASADRALSPAPEGNCKYCGAPLAAGMYFCLVCATPYKTIDAVLPRILPRKLTDGELIDHKAPGVKPIFYTYLSVLVGCWTLSCLMPYGDSSFMMILGTIALVVTTCILGAIYWKSLAVQLKRFGFFHPAAWIGLAALVPLLAINFGYGKWMEYLFEFEKNGSDESPEVGLSKLALVLMVCVSPAIIEEIAFRGLIQHWLHAAIRPFMAIVLASALFAGIHLGYFVLLPIFFPYLFAVGMLLGWVKWKTGSLYPCMLIHFLHNLVVVYNFFDLEEAMKQWYGNF